MILGITGAIGSGKSLITDAFFRRNWRIFSADDFCRRWRQSPDAAALAAIRRDFGDRFFDDDGKLDSRRIADAVFSEPEWMKKWLDLVYPALDAALDAAIARCRAENVNGAFEIPLLFENHYETKFDAVLAVWSGRSLRYDRLRRKRHLDDAEIERREALQMAEDQKLELADYAVINTASVAEVEAQLDDLLKTLNPKKGMKNE